MQRVSIFHVSFFPYRICFAEPHDAYRIIFLQLLHLSLHTVQAVLEKLSKMDFKQMFNKLKNMAHWLNWHQALVEYITYFKFHVSDGYDTGQETSNSQQYG